MDSYKVTYTYLDENDLPAGTSAVSVTADSPTAAEEKVRKTLGSSIHNVKVKKDV